MGFEKNIICVIILIMLVSCNQNKGGDNSKEIIVSQPALAIEWDEVNIATDYQMIHLYKNNDTTNYLFWDLDNDSLGSYRVNNKDSIILLNKAERDSILKIVYKIITQPVITDKKATNGIGNLTVSLKAKSTELFYSSSSTNNWTTISPEAKQLSVILGSKIKIKLD